MRLARPLGGWRTFGAALAGGAAAALALYLVSLRDYGAGDGGAPLARLVRESYVVDLVRANAKLAALLVAAGAVHGALAGVVLVALEVLRGRATTCWRAVIAGAISFALETLRGLLAAFVVSPGGVVALCPYDAARFDPLYDHLRPWMVDAANAVLLGGASLAVLTAMVLRARAGLARAGRVRRPLLLGGVVAFATTGVFVGGEPKHPGGDRRHPNVLVLLTDSLRADRVGAVRNGEPVTPSIDALAARGCSFTNCFVPVARTTESIVSLFTASFPQSHGVRTSWVAPDQCRLRVKAFPEVFRDAGYDTYATGEWNASDFGRFELGFDRACVPEETWNLRTIVSRGGRATAFLVRLHYGNALGEWLAPEIYYDPGAYGVSGVTSRVTRELTRAARSGKPTLLVAFYAPTHAPFTARGDHLHAFTDPTYQGPNRYCLMAKTMADAVSLQEKTMRARDLAQVEGVYDAAVRTFDDEVGAVLDALAATGEGDRTIVVVGSDHGTAFYERGSFGQGNEIASDVSNRVPLVVYDPRSAHGPGRATHVVRSIDLAPTLCDLAGLAAPQAWEGRSLRAVLDDPGRDLGLVAYAETGLWIGKQSWQSADLDFGFPSIYDMLEVPDRRSGLIATKDYYVRLMIRAQHRMVRDDRWKLLYVPTRGAPIVSLYDLTADLTAGNERPVDVAREHPDVVARLRLTLDALLAREPPGVFEIALPPPRAAPGHF